MAYFCVDENCENCEPVEDKMVCPRCGAQTEQVYFMEIQTLIDKKRRHQRLNDKLLFNVNVDVDKLTDRLSDLITELAEFESKKIPRDSDEAKILIVLAKIQAVESQILIQIQIDFIGAVRRLMGI